MSICSLLVVVPLLLDYKEVEFLCNGQLATFLGSIYRGLDPKEFDKEGKEKEEGEAYRPS